MTVKAGRARPHIAFAMNPGSISHSPLAEGSSDVGQGRIVAGAIFTVIIRLRSVASRASATR